MDTYRSSHHSLQGKSHRRRRTQTWRVDNVQKIYDINKCCTTYFLQYTLIILLYYKQTVHDMYTHHSFWLIPLVSGWQIAMMSHSRSTCSSHRRWVWPSSSLAPTSPRLRSASTMWWPRSAHPPLWRTTRSTTSWLSRWRLMIPWRRECSISCRPSRTGWGESESLSHELLW